MEFDLIVQGGRLITAESSFTADVGVKDGRIAAIGSALPASSAVRVLDATGMLVAPGAIDVHTHFATDVGGRTSADDYESGSRAAAAGGITTFVNFAFQGRDESLHDAVEREVARAEGKSHIDYGFHVVVTDASSRDVLAEIPSLAAEGFPSLKLFTAADDFRLGDEEILRVLAAAAEHAVMVNVHAEDHGLVSYLTRRLLSAGKAEVRHLPEARPPEAEALATARVAAYARLTGAAVYFVHLSCREALDAVRRARAAGAQIFVETRPAYLHLDRDRYALPNREGNKYVAWPPLRDVSDQEALWAGLRNGEIQTYATDHTTWLAAEKMDPSLSFADIPPGLSNVQTSIGMLFGEGVAKGQLTESQFVAVTATNPAKLFGLWPRKGTLAVGSDADMMLIDPERRFRVHAETMESRSDFDPYEGYESMGWPVTTIARGELIVENGQVQSRPGRGHWLRRERFRPV
jgi:dihydropyrimidinase